MKIKKLIKELDIEIVKGSKDVEIEAITSNSKLASPGSLFIAKRGKKFDGNDYINNAVLAGAVAVMTDIYNPFIENIVQIIVNDVEKAETQLAKTFYQDPSNELFMVGITGTNGKTTTSYLTRHLIKGQESMGLIGTIERIVGEYSYASDLTLPDCPTTLKLLRDMASCNQTSAVLEICSHGLHQNRADALTFDVAAFTNLSPEHLDYHKTMEEYFAQKHKLFGKLKPSGVAIVNGDDIWGKKIKAKQIVTYGIENEADYSATAIQYSETGTSFCLKTPEGSYQVKTPLLGKFNVYNTLCAVAVAKTRGMEMELILERLKTLAQINGRMEKFSVGEKRDVYVDFAHTKEALKNAIEAVKEIAKEKVIVIFGCGGVRDFGKRPEMAKVAEEFADFTIVTSDNPRSETPEKIVEEIVAGFQTDKYAVEIDRREAINKGIGMMQEGDILLIAGKGHEKKQIFHGKSVDFDDITIAKELANCLI